MTAGTEALKQAFRDFQTDGIPASGANEPIKPEIRAALDALNLDIVSAGAGGDPDAVRAIIEPARNDAVAAAGFPTLSEANTFAPSMTTGQRTTVSTSDTGTHAAVAGEVRLDGTAATVGEAIPNAGVYEKQAGGALLRVGSLGEQISTEQAALAESAREATEDALDAASGLLLPNYDPYFTSFLDASIDIDGRIMDAAVDYQNRPYETPLKSWATPRVQSANYEPRVVNGLLWVRPATGADRQLTTTPAHIRNVMMSPNEQSVFFEQYMGMRLGWQRMHIRADGTQIAYPRTSTSDICGDGDSISAGNGGTANAAGTGLSGASVPNSFNAGSGYPLALWLDPQFRAAGIEVYNFGFSGSPSWAIADNYEALADDDPHLSMTNIVCIGRNNVDPVVNLADLKRIEAKMKPYNKRLIGFDIPYRRSSNKIGMAARTQVDAANAAMKAYLGPERWADTNAHMIDPGPNGALAIAIARGDVDITEPTAQDLQDFADGVPPQSLIFQGDGGDVHPNNAGHYANKDVIKPVLVANGVLSQ